MTDIRIALSYTKLERPSSQLEGLILYAYKAIVNEPRISL